MRWTKYSRCDGCWGVVPASQHQEKIVALASLIRTQRYEMALTILHHEIDGCSKEIQ